MGLGGGRGGVDRTSRPSRNMADNGRNTKTAKREEEQLPVSILPPLLCVAFFGLFARQLQQLALSSQVASTPPTHLLLFACRCHGRTQLRGARVLLRQFMDLSRNGDYKLVVACRSKTLKVR